MSSGDGDIFFNRNQSQIFPKSIYRVYTVLTTVLDALLTEISKYFKINMEIELRVDKTLFKKNKFGRLILCKFKTFEKAREIKI